MALGEKNEAFQAELLECSHQLSCATQLIITLLRWAWQSRDGHVTVTWASFLSLRLSVQMDGEDYAILRASLSPIVTADSEQVIHDQIWKYIYLSFCGGH